MTKNAAVADGIDEGRRKMGAQALETIDLSGVETWREYDFGGRVYRIESPKSVWWRRGGTTHRVVDAEGVAHVVPAPGHLGCVMRFKGEVVA